MINRRYQSFAPLLDQLQKYGSFSSTISVSSPAVKEISDFLYNQLITFIKRDKFPHSGVFFDIRCSGNSSIFISTFSGTRASYINCFHIKKGDFELLQHHIEQISLVYTSLFCERKSYVSHEFTVMYREVSE